MTVIHKHHIIPVHAGGSDDPDNIVELTVLDHAIAHRHLWKMYGRVGDKVAWLMLSSQTDNPMKVKEMANKMSQTRKKMFKEGKLPMPINKPETLKKHSERMKLNNPNKGGACNHTSYPIRVYFEDGSEKDFEYMKQLTEERGIPYSSLKNARRNGTPLKIYSIKKVVKIEKIACEG